MEDGLNTLHFLQEVRPQFVEACAEGNDNIQLDELAVTDGGALNVVANACDAVEAIDRQIERLQSKATESEK